MVIQSESLYYMFPRLFLRAKLFRYFNDLAGTMDAGSIYIISNGLHLITRPVVGMFYRRMKRRADLVYDVTHREWHEARSRYENYDLKVFKFRG